MRVLAGREPHHIVETQFKAFARAFRDAVAIDPRETGVPSTKGSSVTVPNVVVLDYGSGNLRSAVRAVERAGAEVTLTGDFDTALDADGLVVPGVGAYAACMAGLRAIRGERIIGRRLAGGRPVLGICVGMQVLFERGVEHGVETEGCDEWPGVVERIQAPVVPHMGWNTVDVPDGHARSSTGIEDERFYFVHSYGVRDWTLVTNDRTRAPLVTWSEHGGRPVRRGGRERPAHRDPVPPREVRRRGCRAAAQLGRRRCHEQGARPAPRRARAGGRRPGRGPGGRGRAQGAPRRPEARR